MFVEINTSVISRYLCLDIRYILRTHFKWVISFILVKMKKIKGPKRMTGLIWKQQLVFLDRKRWWWWWGEGGRGHSGGRGGRGGGLGWRSSADGQHGSAFSLCQLLWPEESWTTGTLKLLVHHDDVWWIQKRIVSEFFLLILICLQKRRSNRNPIPHQEEPPTEEEEEGGKHSQDFNKSNTFIMNYSI